MPLNNRRALDSRWSWHNRSVPVGHMPVVCEVFRRTGDVHNYDWDPATGQMTGGGLIMLYRGQARFVINKEWRARIKTARGDTGIQHATRIQIPIRQCPPIHAYDIIRPVQCMSDPELTHFIFIVRNMLPSGNHWVRNILGDTDVAHPRDLPPPMQAEPVTAEMAALAVTEDCGCGCGGGG